MIKHILRKYFYCFMLTTLTLIYKFDMPRNCCIGNENWEIIKNISTSNWNMKISIDMLIVSFKVYEFSLILFISWMVYFFCACSSPRLLNFSFWKHKRPSIRWLLANCFHSTRCDYGFHKKLSQAVPKEKHSSVGKTFQARTTVEIDVYGHSIQLNYF